MLYVFLDESGDFDFSTNGSKYFIITALSVTQPLNAVEPLLELKYNLWQSGLPIEYFHASEDKQRVRDQVFGIIQNNLSSYKVDCIVVEKRKTFLPLQQDTARFYEKMFSILLNYVLSGSIQVHSDMTIVTDTIPLKKKRQQIEKALKKELANWAKQSGGTYQLFHFASKTDMNLQVVDYIGWAIARKWARADYRSFKLIHSCVKSQFDVFRSGNETFY